MLLYYILLRPMQAWNGHFFAGTTLRQLGLVIQLGHSPDPKKSPDSPQPEKLCLCPRRARTGFVVVDVDSVQEVEIAYCQCQHTDIVGDSWQQLMRRRLFPATIIEPHTAFTFRCLAFFHNLTLHGKLTPYEYYIAVERNTDGSGLQAPKRRYSSLLRAMRVWRRLELLKHAGIACDLERPLDSIRPGELALRCWPCPRPGVNMPQDISIIPAAEKYVHGNDIT
jgi:hypothetical protein